MTLTVGSLFAGIGGMDLGLERAGMVVRWQAEIDEWCRGVLARHWPDVTRYEDVRRVDWSTVPAVDVIAGGFPCPPVSCAGKGLAQADERWLWPEVVRCLRAVRPRYVVLENVRGLLTAADGTAFGDVLGDLARLGFDAEWELLSAAGVGAPHLRQRVFVVAWRADGEGQRSGRRTEPQPVRDREERTGLVEGAAGVCGALPDADGRGRAVGAELNGEPAPDTADRRSRGRHADGLRDALADAERRALRAPAVAVSGGLDSPFAGHHRETEFAGWWATEPAVGRVAHGVPERVDRLRGLGNAVVPQVAELVGRLVVDFDRSRRGVTA